MKIALAIYLRTYTFHDMNTIVFHSYTEYKHTYTPTYSYTNTHISTHSCKFRPSGTFNVYILSLLKLLQAQDSLIYIWTYIILISYFSIGKLQSIATRRRWGLNSRHLRLAAQQSIYRDTVLLSNGTTVADQHCLPLRPHCHSSRTTCICNCLSNPKPIPLAASQPGKDIVYHIAAINVGKLQSIDTR